MFKPREFKREIIRLDIKKAYILHKEKEKKAKNYFREKVIFRCMQSTLYKSTLLIVTKFSVHSVP